MHDIQVGPRVRLRGEAYAEWAAGAGLETEVAQAERLGVAQSSLNRVRRGTVTPGERFIAAVLAATGRTFEQLFEIVPATPAAAAHA
jgi:hypothetical protein